MKREKLRERIVELLLKGCCRPSFRKLSRKLKVPLSTVHYNVERLEKEGCIRGYKAVFDYRKVGKGFCAFVLINLAPEEYPNPERIGKMLSRLDEIESVDVVTGDWELLVKVRVKDQEEYYEFVRKVLARPGIVRIKSLVSLRELKGEFIPMPEERGKVKKTLSR